MKPGNGQGTRESSDLEDLGVGSQGAKKLGVVTSD
jgi:hypothetical protein